jgi:hypothetical protein
MHTKILSCTYIQRLKWAVTQITTPLCLSATTRFLISKTNRSSRIIVVILKQEYESKLENTSYCHPHTGVDPNI